MGQNSILRKAIELTNKFHLHVRYCHYASIVAKQQSFTAYTALFVREKELEFVFSYSYLV